MRSIDLKCINKILSEMGYSKNEDNKFLIDLNIDDLNDEDWNKIIYRICYKYDSTECSYPAIAFEQLFKEITQDYPGQLASQIFDDVFYDDYIHAENNIKHDVKSKIEILIRETTEIHYSIEKIMKQEIRVNIGVNTGDIGWDYTANNVPPGYGADHYLSEADCASIIWLTKQQGHKKSELQFALDHIKKESHLIKNEFMFSLANEVWHEMSCFNQLFFLVIMTVKDILQLNSLLKWHNETGQWGGYIIINKEAATGFYASEIGSTSLLGIKLENDVKLPIKYIDCIIPDIAFTNSIYDITYDCDLWDDGKIIYCSLPKKFRLNMNDMGLTPIKKNVRHLHGISTSEQIMNYK